MTDEYKLSVELAGHFGVVRHVEALPGNIFATSSRDCTVRIWKLVDNAEWGLLNLLNCHEQLADKAGIAVSHYIPAGTPGYPESAIVSGGYDSKAVVSHPETSQIYHTLSGHKEAVVSITHTHGGDIVTGSLDKTINVWRNGALFRTLRGHQSIVWALTTLPNGDLVSGSSDKTIRIWRNFQCIKTIQTNSYIRGLCVVPEVGFLSCGSAEMLQLWSYEGDNLYDLMGHKDTVYSASVLPSGELISSSEDGSVIVWNGTEMKMQLATPCPVWSVASMENGDIIAACQDKMVRVFTKDPARQMNDELFAKYMDDCMAAAAVLAEAAKPEQHVVNGQTFDHIINVDLEEGRPTIPLGYNDDEEAVTAAERFIAENNISPFYMDQITQFIANAMGPKKLAPGTPYVDPFRDNIPSTIGGQPAPKPQQAPAQQHHHKHFPAIKAILVEHGQSAQVLTKLKQINSQFTPEESVCVLSPEELECFDSISHKVGQALANPSSTQTTHFSIVEMKALLGALMKWPEKDRFPLLDLARLAILLPDFANQAKENLLDMAKSNLESANSPVTHLMALRLFCNAFRWQVLTPKLDSLAEFVLEQIVDLLESSNTHVPPLAISLLRNYATHLAPGKSEARVQILSIVLSEVLWKANVPAPIAHLGLYSIGTLLEHDAALKLVASEMGIPAALEVFHAHSDAHVSKAAKDITAMFAPEQ